MATDDRAALVADAVKFLAVLLGPCQPRNGQGSDHGWHDCDRCLAYFDLESRQPYAVRLMTAAIAALSAPPCPEGAAPPPAPREAVRVLAGLRAAAATACEACEAGMRLSESSLHYHDGPGYEGSQSGDTWGVCRKVVAALRAEGE